MPALLLIIFVVVPLAELYVILQVADVIGGWETIAVLIAESVFGTWLIKREGRRTWRAFQAALDAGRAPAREVADGALVIVGGTLLVTPGFLSDVVGFFFLLPPTRPLARRLLLRFATRRLGRRFGLFTPRGFGRRAAGQQRVTRPARAPRPGPVVEGQVVEGRVVEGQVIDPGPDNEKPPTP